MLFTLNPWCRSNETFVYIGYDNFLLRYIATTTGKAFFPGRVYDRQCFWLRIDW